VKKVPRRLSSQIVSLHRYAVAAALVIPVAVWQSASDPEASWEPTPALLVGLLGLIGAFAGTAYIAGLRRVPVHRGALLSYLEPVTAALLAQLFLGEEIGLSLALGAMLILAGSYIVVSGRPESAPSPTRPGEG
jgi:drug/metabolite transporter (DMT)-like permease